MKANDGLEPLLLAGLALIELAQKYEAQGDTAMAQLTYCRASKQSRFILNYLNDIEQHYYPYSNSPIDPRCLASEPAALARLFHVH